jgi:hypothetical protein
MTIGEGRKVGFGNCGPAAVEDMGDLALFTVPPYQIGWMNEGYSRRCHGNLNIIPARLLRYILTFQDYENIPQLFSRSFAVNK